MHRIDSPSATPDNKFTEGSPTGGVAATVVTAAWLNDLQENVSEVIEAAGIPLSKGNSAQLFDAIQALFLGSLGVGGSTTNDYVKIPYKDKVTGVRRELIVQRGAAFVTGGIPLTVTLPVAFASGGSGFAQWASSAITGGVAVKGSFATSFPTLGSMVISPTDSTGTYSVAWFAFGNGA